MTAVNTLSPRHDAHEMVWRAYQSAKESEDRERRRRVFIYLRRRWTNASPRPSGLKPFSHLWNDIAAQRNDAAAQEDDFWKQVARSIREGFFNHEHKLFSVIDRKTRVTSVSLRETLRWDDEAWPYLRELLRDSWSTIETLCAWAWLQRYEPPRSWQAVLSPASSTQQVALDPLDAITRKKVRAAAKALRHLQLPDQLPEDRRLIAVNEYLEGKDDKISVSRNTLNDARKALAAAKSSA